MVRADQGPNKWTEYPVVGIGAARPCCTTVRRSRMLSAWRHLSATRSLSTKQVMRPGTRLHPACADSG
jgi:hypothetical protein